ncbi:ParB/RepB/Spo0J family partition protein [Pelagerythrobacter marensis]|uniref:ParB/RepB/Spo0J family partition protein n=1 Tax=Pelagerythrobacter marensis TaxID=543877 RepID=A0ABZ2D1Z1_9SPHN
MTEQRTYTHAELAISPLNVRYNEEDCAAVEVLAASIVEEGQLQQLLLHTAPPKAKWAGKAKFGVWAGGRRWRAIGLAIADGRLPADFPIKAELRDEPEGQIVLDSLGENLLRRDLRGYEVHKAIARAVELGETVEAIATRIGQSPDWVRRQLRLGQLQPEIFDAYSAGEISYDQAQAYAATEDTDLQRAAWLHFRSLSTWEASPVKIRAFLKVGDRELGRLLLFVGEAIYRSAGGRFELDLFADGPDDAPWRGRVTDETLLRRLAEEKFEVLRNQVREDVQDRDLRFQASPPTIAGYPDVQLEISATRRKDRLLLPKEAQGADIVATIEIDDEGEWEPRFWWASRKARKAAQRAVAKPGQSPARDADIAPICGEAIDNPDSTYGQRAREIVRDEHGLTADGLQVVRSLRREILRALLIRDAALGGTLARDYLTWAQLRIALADSFGGGRKSAVGARGLAGEEWAYARDAEPRDKVKSWVDDTVAHHLWHEALGDVSSAEWMVDPDPVSSFVAWLELPEGERHLAEAVLAGLALERSANTPGWRIAVHDELAQRADGDAEALRILWQPTPAFVGLFGKLQRLAMAQPFVDPDAFKSWHKQKDKAVSGAVSAALQGECGGSQSAAAKRWVHPLLSFGEGSPRGAEDGARAKRGKRASATSRPSEALEPAE